MLLLVASVLGIVIVGIIGLGVVVVLSLPKRDSEYTVE